MLPVAFAFLIPLQTPAPTPPVQGPEPAPTTRHGIPGNLPGTERWLVTFKSRSFDLEAFRKANMARDADAVARISEELDKKVLVDQQGFVEFVERLGGAVTAQWWLVNGMAIEIPPKHLPKVAAHPRVQKTDPEEIVYPVGFIKTSTNSKNHNSDSVYNQNIRGKGVTLAIMDTGLDNPCGSKARPHRTFFVNGDINNKTGGGIGGSRLTLHKNFGRMSNADDPHNHGTGVAGIAAGEVWGNTQSDRGHSPLAWLGNYKIADSSGGGAQYQNIVNAYQQMAKDAAANKFAASNNSYTGSPDPTHVSQQALDSAALNANFLPVVAAGNSSSSTGASQSAANGIAVAAIQPAVGGSNDKKVATFSSRGPLSGDTQRFYPDIAGNGVGTVMPKRDSETTNYVASGTSMASPQVCGAAGLLRSVRPTITVLEMKSSLLATTEDISKQNPNPPYNSRNAYGMGYMRADRLIAHAQSTTDLITTKKVTSTTTPVTQTFRITKGKGYAVAISWFRHTLTAKAWSDINLTVKMGNNTLGASNSPRNLYEKVVFLAPATSIATIEISATSIEAGQTSIDVGLVATEIPPPFVDGKMLPYGLGCLGTGKQSGVENVLPTDFKSTFGKSYNELGVGYDNHRYQQVFNRTVIPQSFQARIMAFRFEDQSFPGAVTNYWSELEIDMGYSPNAPDKLSNEFAKNITGATTKVLAKKRVNLPDWTAKNSDVSKFEISIAFDRPFVHQDAAGKYLMVDIKKTNSSVGNTIVNYFVDATNNASKMYASRVYGRTPTATAGSVAIGLGSVMGFNASATGAVPLLDASGVPEINGTYTLLLSQAAPSTVSVFIVGLNKLNIDLSGAGATGCKLLASLDLLLIGVPTDALGKAQLTLPVPNDKNFIQANLFYQNAILDPGANAFGWAFTRGLNGIIGGQP